ncbi:MULTISPECIES: IS66 family insertion sequence element accessory protein TnpB [unclassified Mesorhizobium]|uniref:IS66 family insertion sequence element accessory protein TnpB n=1 Tax=unclassified Mesorhizobium TaxID=325217 RepID=UPI00333531FD
MPSSRKAAFAGGYLRATRADRIKIVWWDGSGVCLYAKRLDDAKFCWPRIGHHRVQLNHAQLMALVDGMDWKRVRTETVRRPQSVGKPCGMMNQGSENAGKLPRICSDFGHVGIRTRAPGRR